MEFLYEYGLFLLKAMTFVVAIMAVVGFILASASKDKTAGEGKLKVTDLSEQLADQEDDFLAQTLDKKAYKQWQKAQKKAPEGDTKPRVFVLDFDGSADAHEVTSLKEEVNAVLQFADASKDQVLIRLESPGGVVHGYGLGASQITRLKDAGLIVSVSVDKVAASGGYMMACVASKIYAAPFAILGSIGVVAQLPNFHRLLKKNDIDVELFTAGEYKRTVTVFGENTEAGKTKFSEELNETHDLFKDFVKSHRDIDLDKVATGEHWYGAQALELGLIDEIRTSDDVLLDLAKSHQLLQVQYRIKQGLVDKFSLQLSNAFLKTALKQWQKNRLYPF